MDEVLQKAAKLKDDKIDELLAVFDKDIEHIQDSLLRLDKLRSLLIKPNNESLDKLLESIRNLGFDIFLINLFRSISFLLFERLGLIRIMFIFGVFF